MSSINTKESISIALSKGRIFKDTLPLLLHAGIEPLDDPESSRKLILDTNHEHIKLVIIRASDVPTYVEYGATDLGIAGKDVLMEKDSKGIYEPLDLDIAKCKLMVAGFANHQEKGRQELGHLRVATKYVQTTQRYYAQKGQQVEVIKLYGSMELAPLVGLADCIVDVVDTGGTLKANGLVPLETIAHISSRLIVNKASMKLKNPAIKAFIAKMAEAVQRKKEGEKKP